MENKWRKEEWKLAYGMVRRKKFFFFFFFYIKRLLAKGQQKYAYNNDNNIYV